MKIEKTILVQWKDENGEECVKTFKDETESLGFIFSQKEKGIKEVTKVDTRIIKFDEKD